MSTKRAFLASKHPAWVEQSPEWRINDRRLNGGLGVLKELTPFDWEVTQLGASKAGRDVQPDLFRYHDMIVSPPQTHYELRQQNAVYLNFPDRFASIMAGHLIRNSPQVGSGLNFGTLGDVRRKQDIDSPSAAELLYYNTDGAGADGSQWRTYWLHVLKGAMASGVRWVLCEGPGVQPKNVADWEKGLRPYLSDYSPLSVRNWQYENGRLMMAIIYRTSRKLRLGPNNELVGNSGEPEILLLTADGFDGFGKEFSKGGWFRFDKEHELTGFGFYDDVEGQIPMTPLFYERRRPTEESMAFCRSGVFELGQAAVAYMNLSSSADFDAQDGAASAQAILGADEEGFNLFVRKRNEGNRYAPLPPHRDSPGMVPSIQDASTGAIAADVFDKRLKSKRQEAEELMLNELEAAPYASGASKEASFADAKEPRLAVLAGELETAQNSVIHFMERMWGFGKPRPTGSVEWPETFALERPLTEIKEFFQTAKESGLRSPTAETKAYIMMTRKLGITGDDESRTQVEAEVNKSALRVLEMLDAEKESLLRPEPTGATS
jgi:hypothetical protein